MPSSSWPPLITADIARQSTLVQAVGELQAALATLSGKVDILMTEDATVAAAAAAIEADVAKLTTAINALQALIIALEAQAAAGALTPATEAALAKAKSDLDSVTSAAQADVTEDVPPSGA